MDRPVLHTELCDLLDIEYPIILAGMGPTVGGGQGGVAGPELVAAVSNAGGLGVLGAAGFPQTASKSKSAASRTSPTVPSASTSSSLPTSPAAPADASAPKTRATCCPMSTAP